MQYKNVIGIDLGGTNVRGAVVNETIIGNIQSKKINAKAPAHEVLNELFAFTDQLMNNSITAIGIGVPGLVKQQEKMVYDVVFIPAWTKIPLQQLMEDRYHVPVYAENDANCFALGELYFGKGRSVTNMVGLTLGTGVGGGIIINKKLHPGRNGGAGEFGMVEYLEHNVEYYTSGQFFQHIHNTDGETVFKHASAGDADALKMYDEFGVHLGNTIKTILYSLDVELIVLGGSVSKAFSFYSASMWKQLQTFGFPSAIPNIKIEVSDLQNAGIMGAAGLCYNFNG